MKSFNGPLRIGIGGPVGAGKTSLTEGLCNALSNKISMACLLYTSPSPRDKRQSRMPSSA